MVFAAVLFRTLLLSTSFAALLGATGCSTLASLKEKIMGKGDGSTVARTIDYKSQGTVTSVLEVPPALTVGSDDDRAAPRTASSLAEVQAVPRSSEVLPQGTEAQVMRSGSQRWLVVKGSPEAAWEVAKRFWTGSGYALAITQPSLGLMETDWLEGRARVPSDFVRRSVGNYADVFGDARKRDKFRTRLEWGTEPGTVEIYVSHQGSEQMPAKSGDRSAVSISAIVWTPVAANAETEAEMLARLAAAFGSPGALDPVRTAASPSATAMRLARDASGASTIVVDDGFDRVWRRIGLALDRSGFTVVDRDRSKGLYYVRYADPEIVSKKEGSFLSKLAFWRTDEKPKPEQYRIAVADAGQSSVVSIQNPSGAPDRSPNGEKILGLLRNELK